MAITDNIPTPPTAPAPRRARTFPAATLVIALVSGAVYFFPATNGFLLYQRSLLLGGEVWRAWTGHLVHYTAGHFLWNLVGFLLAGCWLESVRPRSARWYYLVTAPVISATLLIGDPSLQRYAGLSGVVTGLLVYLALVQLSENKTEPKWFWISVLALVTLKIVLETVTRIPLLVRDLEGYHVVPLAHISGILTAVIAWVITRASRKATAS